MTTIRYFLRYWLPPLAWCTIIFSQSAFATPRVVPHWPHFDKVLHAGVYALLGLLFYRALDTLAGLTGRRALILALSAVMATLFGAGDEWHQSFVPARSAEFADLLADFTGGVLGALFIAYIFPKLPFSKR